MKKRSLILALAALVCLCALAPAAAASGKPEGLRNVNLDPALLRPAGGWDLGDHQIYFGQYGGQPMLFRVLPEADTQTFPDGDEGLLLDCGRVLRRKAFDSNFKRNEGQEKLPSEWKGSDLELWLGGSAFYESRSVFTHLEQAAIALTTLADAREPYSTSHWENMYRDFGSTDYVFLLSAAEVTALYAQEAASAKDGATTDWWTRSAFDMGGNGSGSVHFDGHVCNNSVSNFVVGISPAFNARLSSIVLVTPAREEKPAVLSKTQPQPDTREWKLTILDPTKTVAVPDGQAVTREDDRITVPYVLTGAGITRLSLVIADPNGQVLYYGPLDRDAADCTAVFTLPQELQYKACGKDYSAYLLAESCNGPCRTDYSSALCPIDIPK